MEKIEIVNIHAQELMRVQERVVKIKCIQEGKRGIYDQKPPTTDQTYCNHAEFLTIKAVDGDYLKFTDNYNAPVDSSYPKYDVNYQYKQSSYWCVVLRKQANKGELKKLTTCQEILKYANQGYVVIVAWENTSGGPPHYATVQPQPENNSSDIKRIKLCNVSSESRTNMDITIESAFGSKQCEFFVNPNQKFREYYEQIIELEKRIE